MFGNAISNSARVSPSLRGSGLKSYLFKVVVLFVQSPSLRGSGLKYIIHPLSRQFYQSPSLRGSGLKFMGFCCGNQGFRRLPLYEGVD